MYLNFSNFPGRTSAGGGGEPWSKNGDKCQMRGLRKFLLDGGPPVPQGKPPAFVSHYLVLQNAGLKLITNFEGHPFQGYFKRAA